MSRFLAGAAIGCLALLGSPDPVMAADPSKPRPPSSVAEAAPRQPAPRRFTNEDLPARPEVSVIGTDRPAPTLEQLRKILPGPSAAPIRPPEAPQASDEERRRKTDSFVPPGDLLELIGARGAACVFGACPDGRPPLAPLVPWSGEKAREAIRETWSRPVVAPVPGRRSPAAAPPPASKPSSR